MAKRPIGSPKTTEFSSVPAAKRRIEGARANSEHKITSFPARGRDFVFQFCITSNILCQLATRRFAMCMCLAKKLNFSP